MACICTLRAVAHRGRNQRLEAGLLFCESLLLHNPEVVYLLSFHQKTGESGSPALAHRISSSWCHQRIQDPAATSKITKLADTKRGGMGATMSVLHHILRETHNPKLLSRERHCVVSGFSSDSQSAGLIENCKLLHAADAAAALR